MVLPHARTLHGEAASAPAVAVATIAPEQHALTAVLNEFPAVTHGFAYGSAVFPQPGAERLRAPGEAPMVDFIFAVDDPVSWHEANLARNRVHYSLLARAGAPAVVAVSERVGCGVHWNAYARLSTGQTIKYGVVRTDSLVRDLTTWDALYVAGRLHKPVRVVASDARVAAAAQTNLRSALAAALLLLPPEFSEAQLHAQLVGLSYGGDVRLAFGAEDPHKVGRIAAGSAPALRQLYTGAVAAAAAGLWSLPARRWAQKADAAAREALLRQLPRSLLRRLAPEAGEDAAAAAASVAASPQPAARVRAALAATVRASSARAAVAGLLTAGLGGATRYAAQKFAKAWRLRATSAAGATCL